MIQSSSNGIDRQLKIAVIIEWGTYCYKVMPFGLRNAKATNQRMAISIFHDMMHKEVEAYVDDIIVKSDIREAF